MVRIIQVSIKVNLNRQAVALPAEAEIVDAIYQQRDDSWIIAAHVHPELLERDRHNKRYFLTAATYSAIGDGLRDFPAHIRTAIRANGMTLHLYEMKNLSGGA